MEKVMLTLPPELLRELDDQVQRRKQTRSQVVRQILSEWLQEQRKKEFETLLAEGYQELTAESAEIRFSEVQAQAAAAEEVWQWDE